MAKSKQGIADPADVEAALGGVDYPASKDNLLQQARDNNASQEVLDSLDTLPEDKAYEGPGEVTKELGLA